MKKIWKRYGKDMTAWRKWDERDGYSSLSGSSSVPSTCVSACVWTNAVFFALLMCAFDLHFWSRIFFTMSFR
jgi:hypothetical protein